MIKFFASEICSNVSMKFRNYLPHDKQLQEGRVAPPVLPKFEDPVATAPPRQEKKEVFLDCFCLCGFVCLSTSLEV